MIRINLSYTMNAVSCIVLTVDAKPVSCLHPNDLILSLFVAVFLFCIFIPTFVVKVRLLSRVCQVGTEKLVPIANEFVWLNWTCDFTLLSFLYRTRTLQSDIDEFLIVLFKLTITLSLSLCMYCVTLYIPCH